MRTLIRTTIIILLAFFAGQVAPKDAIILPLLCVISVTFGITDFILLIASGRGLVDHLNTPK